MCGALSSLSDTCVSESDELPSETISHLKCLMIFLIVFTNRLHFVGSSAHAHAFALAHIGGDTTRPCQWFHTYIYYSLLLTASERVQVKTSPSLPTTYLSRRNNVGIAKKLLANNYSAVRQILCEERHVFYDQPKKGSHTSAKAGEYKTASE